MARLAAKHPASRGLKPTVLPSRAAITASLHKAGWSQFTVRVVGGGQAIEVKTRHRMNYQTLQNLHRDAVAAGGRSPNMTYVEAVVAI